MLETGWADEELKAREGEKLVLLTADALWDVLRRVACSTKPYTDASCIVMLRKEHVAKVIALLEDRHDAISGPVA